MELLAEVTSSYDGDNDGPNNLPLLMADVSEPELKVWTRGQAIQCLRLGVAEGARRWKRRGRRIVAEIRPEKLALHLGRVGGAMAPAGRGTQPLIIQEKGKWVSDAFQF